MNYLRYSIPIWS